MEDFFEIALKILALIFILASCSILFLPLIEKILNKIPEKDSALLRKIDQKDQEIESLFNRNKELVELLEQKQKELNKRNQCFDELNKKFKKVSAENILNQPEIESLNRTVFRLKNDLTEAQNTIEEYEERIEALESKLKESENRYEKLYKGEIPKEKERLYEDRIAQLEGSLSVVTREYNTLKSYYERNIGYPIFDGTKPPRRRSHSNTFSDPSFLPNPPHSILPSFEDSPTVPEIETFEEYSNQRYVAVLMENAELKARLEDQEESRHLNSPLILRCQIDDYVKSVENNSIKRIEQSNFGMEESFFKNLTASTIMDDGKSSIPSLIHIDETNPFLFSFPLYSEQKNGSWKKYQTSLLSCTCEAWTHTKTNPKTGNKIPCKHMTFLAQRLGIFDINDTPTKRTTPKN